MKFPFCSGFYTAPSVNADAQACMNLFPEQVESGAGRSNVILRSRPANTLWTTLPKSPMRALWAGENRLFAVAGDTLYEVFSGGTYTARGTVGNDGNPAQILSNGNQLAVISDGQFWLDNGAGPVAQNYGQLTGGCNTAGTAVTYTGGDNFLELGPGEAMVITCPGLSGTCNTVNTTVTWVSGDTFGQGMVGQQITVNSVTTNVIAWVSATQIRVSTTLGTHSGVAFSFTPGSGSLPYIIQSVADSFDLTLDSSAGTNSLATYTSYSLSGTVNANGTTVSLTGGDPFSLSMAGKSIVIGNATYTVSQVLGGSSLTLTTSVPFFPGLQNAVYGYNAAVTASTGCLLDDYFIISDGFNSRQINISALLDGTSWNGLDYATKEAYPDNVTAVFADHEQLYLFGDEKSTEVWTDTGNANFPFQRIPNALIHTGNAAPFATSRVKNGLAWISGDVERGCPVAVYCEGFQIQRISTHAIEHAWQQYSQVSDAVSYTMVDEGHEFWIISFPSGNATWAYDFRTGFWHQRGWWTGTANNRDRTAFHAYVGFTPSDFPLSGTHYGGDYAQGNIYTMSTSVYRDQTGVSTFANIYRIRTAPYIANENLRMFFSAFELLMETGPSNVVNPTLDYSVDQGHTFINPQTISSNQAGITDQYGVRLRWRRLGYSRSRIFRVTVSDNVKVVMIDGYWEGTLGTN